MANAPELQQEIPANSWVKLEHFEGWVMHRNEGPLLAVVKEGNIFFSGPLVYSVYGPVMEGIRNMADFAKQLYGLDGE